MDKTDDRELVLFTDEKFLSFYRSELAKRANHKELRLGSTNDILKVTSELFKVVSEHIVTNIGGVFLRKIGFFGVWRSATPLVASKFYKRPRFNTVTGGYQYFLMFNSSKAKNTRLKRYSMDRKFSVPLKKRLSVNLNRGYRYRNYLYHFN